MLSKTDRDLIFHLAEELTGACQSGRFRKDIFLKNLEKRMQQLDCPSLESYLNLAEQDLEEYAQLISALTIHTTAWFRENPHFVRFQEILLRSLNKGVPFRLWCAACSTGEEVYSFALMLEEFRRVHEGFEYSITGTDIDPISIEKAETAIYEQKALNPYVLNYKHHLLFGSGKTEGLFTLSKEIRQRCQFQVADLREAGSLPNEVFDIIACRNVLLYFDEKAIGEIVENLTPRLKVQGHLILGHSETINPEHHGLTRTGHSVYGRPTEAESDVKKDKKEPVMPTPKSRINEVLIVDDTYTVRRHLETFFSGLGYKTTSAGSADEASEKIKDKRFDLITLDLKMPTETGEDWLKKIRARGVETPVVIISDVKQRGAGDLLNLLELGAQEFIGKDSLKANPDWVKQVVNDIVQSQNLAQRRVVTSFKNSNMYPDERPDLILIGASTGGPQALIRLLKSLPLGSYPPILIVQHISQSFLKPFADRLAESTQFELGEYIQDTALKANHIYLALETRHIGVAERNGELVLKISNADPINRHKPSVEHLFLSGLGIRKKIMALLLTGMGTDGAQALLFLRQAGAYTVAQSAEDCVVFGMPKEAISKGGAQFIGNLNQIADVLSYAVKIEKKSHLRGIGSG